MKNRLFWKILAGFWITFMLINVGTLATYYMQVPDEHPSREWRYARNVLGPTYLAAAQVAFEAAGTAGFERAKRALDEDDALFLEPGDAAAPEAENALRVSARAPDGTPAQLVYRLPDRGQFEWELLDLFELPDDWVYGIALAGFVFSIVLAWYVTRPVQRLRKGFERLAGGDFTTRLQPVMGRRRDEIASLAKDFDLMAERLQQLVSVRDQLLHDVSHELRSPLTRLNLAVALLRRDPQHAEASFRRIEMEIRRLDELVGELLSLARTESGETAHETYFDLPELVRSVVANAAFEAGTRGIRIASRIGEGSEAMIRGNAELMRRALENIVRNAVRVSRPQQTVQVALDIRPGPGPGPVRAVLTVADEGPGVSADMLEKMFDPFVRLDTPGQGQGQGYGLGLSIARRAVLALGGTIEAGNRSPSGLAVAITLPVQPTPESGD